MQDFLQTMMPGGTLEDFFAEKNKLVPTLPPNYRNRLNEIFSAYLARFGVAGAVSRFKNRSIAQIFGEHDDAENPTPIEVGNIDGLEYTLYDAKAEPSSDLKAPHEPDQNAGEADTGRHKS